MGKARGISTIKFNGRDVKLTFDMRAVEAIEEDLDLSINQILMRMQIKTDPETGEMITPRFKLFRVMLKHLSARDDNPLTDEEIGAAEIGVEKMIEIGNIVGNAYPDEDPGASPLTNDEKKD
ncbi:hypothetical protein PUV54_00090 [Hyphococcus flavus]|uniref:Tail assembly chaperone n=1 Tax=Hyphococcus flavus TaxID=1866326 RepID=A0AAE9ZF71_9PROT|nr:hypothetical protein [Hyphococcus flavus]WDI31592.1 hypothetical protein PUV54_00090 [Hyphococcus flavus]